MNIDGKKYIIALDQGTTSSRALIFDKNGEVVAKSQREYSQIYPKPGWVEHDPIDIWATQSSVLAEVIAKSNVDPSEIAGIGITNQRETVVVWDKNTGKPIYNAIVWQCRRTAERIEKLRKDKELVEYIRENTGLVADAYFSGTKINWILENVEGAKEKAEKGELLCGTIDTWLVWKFTGGKIHATDHTNASRTMLFNIKDLKWDKKLLNALGVYENMLPEVKSSSELFGYANISGEKIPIAGIAGDQQAALFGQLCFSKGLVKNTYGTGCFLLMNIGDKAIKSDHGLLTTIGISYNGKIDYAFEGSVFAAGATIKWLKDELKLISDPEDSEYFAQKVGDSGGVYFVPAFVGLGAPYWDMYARGTIVGITRGTKREHIIRAGLEAIAYQTRDVLEAMQEDSGIDIIKLKVDGGATKNDFLMQFQADILGIEVQRPKNLEITSRGAAFLAGLAVGFWKSKEEIINNCKPGKVFSAFMDKQEKERIYGKWKKAVEKARDWIDED